MSTHHPLTIVEGFNQLDIHITDQEINQMEKIVIHFEIRGSHPLSLNSQLLGVDPVVFTDMDRQILFHNFNISEYTVNQIIKKIPEINPNNKVPSDPFALLSIWLVHLGYTQIKDEKKRYQFQVNVLKYLHYRYFTSLVNYRFPHGANGEIMLATINSLSRKYDIITYGSWKNVLEKRSKDVLSEDDPETPDSIHIATLKTATPDAKFLYVITDIQTRLRDKINLVMNVYYEFHHKNIKIASSSATYTDEEGQKSLKMKTTALETMITQLTSEVVNIHAFIDADSVEKVASQFTSVSPVLLRDTLEYISTVASQQLLSKDLRQTIKYENEEIIFNVRLLIEKIVQISFRYCANNHVPLSKPAAIWNALKNVYSSSRVNDPQILSVRNSAKYFVDQADKTRREATKSSLRISIIMYVIYKSLKYL